MLFPKVLRIRSGQYQSLTKDSRHLEHCCVPEVEIVLALIGGHQRPPGIGEQGWHCGALQESVKSGSAVDERGLLGSSPSST